MKNKKKKGNFFTLLICNYIVFTLFLIVVLSAFFVMGMFVAGKEVMEVNPDSILEYNNVISNEKYNELPITKIFGEGSRIAILNDEFQVIYLSDREVEISNFTKDEIEYIPEGINEFTAFKEEFTNEKNEKCVAISLYYSKDDKNTQKLYVIDENLNILYQSNATEKVSLTQKEYALLTNTWDSKYSITKYTFKNSENKNNIMLIYMPWENEDVLFSKVSLITKSVFSSFFVFYCILIVIFIMWLNRKVKKPLKLLHNAMMDFSNGERQIYLNYKGPLEFEEICDSFNQMAKQLYESEENRKKLEMDKQKMLADISHDLKTPITVIQGYAKGIYDGIISKEDQPQYLETIYKKSEGLTELINTFYEYSKMEHPDYSLNLEIYDICIFLRNYMADKYNELEIRGFELEVDILEKRIMCKIDQIQLKRAFENIITNFIKHNHNGTTFTCILSKNTHYIKICMADNGSGIPQEISQDIFEPFVVGEKSRGKHGSGLGLAVSKKIIDDHAGSIRLVIPPSNNYKTEFEIILPIIE